MALTYYSTRMIMAAVTSLLICIFFGPTYIRYLQSMRIGEKIRQEECPKLGELHKNKQNTPTMGGGLILTSMLISMLLFMDIKSSFTLLLFLTTISFGFLGAYDDIIKLKYPKKRGISAKTKLLIQLLFSFCIATWFLSPSYQIEETSSHHSSTQKQWWPKPLIKELYSANATNQEQSDPSSQQDSPSSVFQTITISQMAMRLYIPFLRSPLITLSGIVGVCFVLLLCCFVITGSSNAVNFTDGLDGLAAGCLILVSSCLALVAFISNNIDLAAYLHLLYIEGSGEIAIYLSSLAGASLGFLWYNSHPAQLFMGDTGSLPLGAVIGVSSLLLGRPVLLAIIGGIFVAEALSVILQILSFRLRNAKRIFLCAPLHHHFEYSGWPETKVVIRFWIMGLLLALVGLASIKLQ